MTTSVEQLKRELLSELTPERTTLVRNTYLACAALSTGILVALTQVGTREVALKVALAACALATPIFISLAAVLEAYLHIGSDLNTNLLALRSGRLYVLLQVIAGLALYVALCGVVSFLLPWSLFVFLAASLLGAAYVVANYIQIVRLRLDRVARRGAPTEPK